MTVIDGCILVKNSNIDYISNDNRYRYSNVVTKFAFQPLVIRVSLISWNLRQVFSTKVLDKPKPYE